MNKTTYLIVGGASVASLAVGATGGYFFAKNKLGREFDERLDKELASTKKHYGILLAQAKENKPTLDEVAARVEAEQTEEDDEPSDEEILEAEQRANAGKAALTDYQAYTPKGNPGTTVKENIFDNNHSKRQHLPPREPATGRFVKQPTDEPVDPPELITSEEFLDNVPDYEQENLRYFIHDDTLLDTGDEVIENERIGEENLKKFPEVPRDEPSIICVRNHAHQIDYEVLLTHERLTDYMGLGDDEAEDDAHARFQI